MIYMIYMEIVDQLRESGRLDRSLENLSCYDDLGGFLKYGFDFFAHSIYALSLDRKVNQGQPHFRWDGESWLSNIQFICVGMNHPSHISGAPDVLETIRGNIANSENSENGEKLLAELDAPSKKGNHRFKLKENTRRIYDHDMGGGSLTVTIASKRLGNRETVAFSYIFCVRALGCCFFFCLSKRRGGDECSSTLTLVQ